MTDVVAAASLAKSPGVGRSLWGDAWARLRANKAAMFSLFYLVLMAVACVVGPWFVPHSYTTIYADYVRTPPSLSAYPKAEMIETALGDAVRRMRVDVKDWRQEDERIFVTVTSSREIDDRNTRYLDRSDTFDDAKLESKSPDGKEAVMSASIKQQYFLFGTDNTGRDLLSRTLMAGRISLAIGLLAGITAVVIGVIYGATAGFAGGRTDEIMMRIVDVLYSLPFIFFVIMLVVFFGRNFVLMFLAVGAVLWLDMARIVRGQALSIRRQEYRPGGRGARRVAHRHPVPACRAEPARTSRDLHDAAGAAGDHPGELPLLSRARRAGTDDQLGRADRRRRQEHRQRQLAADLPGGVPRLDAFRAELRRRRPARRARSEGSLR